MFIIIIVVVIIIIIIIWLLLYFILIIKFLLSQPMGFALFQYSSPSHQERVWGVKGEWASSCMVLSCQLGLNCNTWQFLCSNEKWPFILVSLWSFQSLWVVSRTILIWRHSVWWFFCYFLIIPSHERDSTSSMFYVVLSVNHWAYKSFYNLEDVISTLCSNLLSDLQ